MNRLFAKFSLFALVLLVLAQPILAGRIDSTAPGFTAPDHREPYRLEAGGDSSLRVILRSAFNRSAAGVQSDEGTAYRGAFFGVDAVRTLDGVAREKLAISRADALVAYDLVEAKGMLAAVSDGRGVHFLARQADDEGLSLSAPLVIGADGRASLAARWVVERQGGLTRLRLAIEDASLRYPIEVSYAQGRTGAVAAASVAALRAATSRTLLPRTNANGTLSGHVSDTSTAAAVPNAIVNVYYNSGEFATQDVTDASGNFAIALPPDTYYVTAEADGYQAKLYNNISCSGGCPILTGNAVTINSGATTSGINFSLSHEATISGVVTNAAGAPLSGVYVVVYDSTGSPVASAVSSSTGAYTATVAGGTYRARTFNNVYQGLVDQLYSGIDCTECNVTTGTAISAPGGTNVSGINFALRNGAIISGSVRDAATNAVVPFGLVTIYNSNNVAVSTQGVDDSGNYSTYFGLAAGTYYAKADFYGYDQQLYNNIPCATGCTPSSGTAITVTLGQQRTGVNFALNNSLAHISGTVRRSDTNAFIGGVIVFVYNSSGARVAAVQSSYNDGTYDVTLSQGGTFYLRTQNDVYPGLVDQLYNGQDCTGCNPTTGTPVAVSSGSTASNINFVLNANAGEIAGTIKDVDNHPINQAYVQIYNAGGTAVSYAYADGAGHYTSFHGLAAGNYYAVASANGFQTLLYDGIACSNGCDPTTGTAIAVASGATTGNINFTLSSSYGRIEGTVTTGANSPLANVNILVYDSTGDLAATAVTDASGNYTAFVPATGTYYVRTLADQYPTLVDELYDDKPCGSGCDPLTGTGVSAAIGAVTQNINFSLGTAACAGFSIQPSSLPDGEKNTPYSVTLSATNSTGTVTFTKIANSPPSDPNQPTPPSEFPPGLTLSGATISGTPTTPGVYTFTIQASDQGGCTTTREYQIEITSGATTTTLEVTPSTGTYPTSFSLKATVEPAGATGTVNFYDTVVSAATLIGSATLNGSGIGTTAVTTLQVGDHELLAVYQGDATHTSSTSSAVLVTVTKGTPTINWTPASPITYGTPLGAAQLNATATNNFGNPVAGTFVYSPPSGTVLNAGTQTLSVTFTPSDTANYNSNSATRTITVDKATPLFSNLSAPTINIHQATTTIGGTLSFSSPPGTLIPPGSVSITINAVTQTAAIQANGSFSATFNTSTLGVGTYTISFSYAGSANYNPASAASTLKVTYIVTGGALPAGSGSTNSTIPFRIQIFDVNNTNLSVSTITVTAVYIRLTSSSTMQPAQTTGNSNDLEFDFQNAGGGSYKFNLKTTGVAPGNYFLGLTVQGDPVTHELPFTVTP